MVVKFREKISVRYFHGVGGGCFGSQYAHWLLRARDLGWLEFSEIRLIDRDPHCLWQQKARGSVGVQLQVQDWTDYLADYLVTHLQDSEARRDHWIPSPLSPHLLLLGFLAAARRLYPQYDWALEPFRENLSIPVIFPLDAGPLAVSFAQWQCPVNCIEPKRCPAIQQERNWDMKNALDGAFAQKGEEYSWHVLQCQHLVHGVGTIPMEKIFHEFESLLQKIAEENLTKIIVATVSGCHGLIGQAGRI